MVTISIEDIQRDLAGYLHRVQAGETWQVLGANPLVAQIQPVGASGEDAIGVREPRPFGIGAGDFAVLRAVIGGGTRIYSRRTRV